VHNVARRALLLVITASLIVSLFAVAPATTTTQADVPDDAIRYVHESIRVDSDDDLDDLFDEHPLWNGTGTIDDPYIIENQTIDAGHNGSAIYLGNITARYVVIRNCTLYGADAVSSTYAPGAGLMLCNVTRAEVANNYCYQNAANGILLLDRCANNTVFKNNCSLTTDGIALIARWYLCENNTIANNTCYSTSESIRLSGQSVSGADDNVISNNMVANNSCINSQIGICLLLAEKNLIDNNDLTAHGFIGIYLESSGNNMISNNSCENYQYGINLVGSGNNSILRNDCSSNGAHGIFLTPACDNSTIEENTCNLNGQFGLQAISLKDSIICNNQFNENGLYGIYLVVSNRNIVDNNTCIGNDDGGISLTVSSENKICHNRCNNTIGTGSSSYSMVGILILGNSDDNAIENNTCCGNGNYGILLYSSRHCLIANNTCNENEMAGIGLRGSSNCNTVMFNTCNDNIYWGTDPYAGAGILVAEGGMYNNVTWNTCNGNGYAGPVSSFVGGGIKLMAGVANGRIENNTCSGNANYGITLESSSYCLIANNTCNENEMAGIGLRYGSSYNNVRFNICNDNTGTGVDAYGCGIRLSSTGSLNRIENNTCTGNSDLGILLESANSCLIANNTCNANGRMGILLFQANANRVLYNHCNLNINHADDGFAIGIYLEKSCGNIIVHNECNGNRNDGVLDGSSSGIALYGVSSGNVIENNTCDANGDFGLHLWHVTGYNYISNNTVIGRGAGIYLADSSAFMYGNALTGCSIHINYSQELSMVGGSISSLVIKETNTVDGKPVYFNKNTDMAGAILDGGYGEYILLNVRNAIIKGNDLGVGSVIAGYCLNITIDNNTISDGYIGIVLFYSDSCNITSNRVVGCVGYGISLTTSDYNYIYNNSFSNNNGASYARNPDHIQAYSSGHNYWNTASYGNFWSDWTGPDADGDGIVDRWYWLDTYVPPLPILGMAVIVDYYPLALDINLNEPTSPAYTNVSSVAVTGNTSSYFEVVGVTWFNLLNGEHGTCSLVAGTNNWTATFRLSEGINYILVNATDEYGNVGTEVFVVYYDTVVPFVEVTRPVDGDEYAINEVSVSWRAHDALSGVDYSMVSVDGGAWIRVDGTRYNILGLDDGEHTVQVMVYDRAGNWILSDIVSFTVDTEGPEVTITSPDDGSYVIDDEVTIEWEATDLVAISYYVISVDGSDFVMVHETSYVLENLADGNHVVIVGAYDVLGNYDETTISFVVDTVEPEVVVSPTGDGIDIDAVVIAQFNKAMNESSVSIVVNGVTGQLIWIENTVTFVPTALEYNKQYTVTVSGKDLAGHELSYSWNFSTMVKIGNIEGVVIDGKGKPVANVTVTLSNGMTATTNSTGHFVFEGVNIGEYNVTFSKDGYVTGSGNVTVVADHTEDMGTITLATKPVSSSVDIVLVIAVLAIFGALIGAFFLYERRK